MFKDLWAIYHLGKLKICLKFACLKFESNRTRNKLLTAPELFLRDTWERPLNIPGERLPLWEMGRLGTTAASALEILPGPSELSNWYQRTQEG